MGMHIALRPWWLQMAWRMNSLRMLVNISPRPSQAATHRLRPWSLETPMRMSSLCSMSVP